MTGGAWMRLAESVLGAGIARGAPMAFAALGELVAERSGVLNLGVEGMMLVGAVAGLGAARASGSLAVGLLAATMAGAALGLVHALIAVVARADQVVSGLAISFLGGGLASVLGAPLVGVAAPHLDPVGVPLLERIPFLGAVLFHHNALVYLALLLPVAALLFLGRTRPGLALRATGESAEAARAMGVRVVRVRCLAVAVGGALAGLGGATLSLAITPGWVDGMVAGQGWIAVGLVIFARWSPLGVVGGAVLFGVVRRLPLDLQGTDLAWFRDPNVGYFLSMLPYLLTVLVLVLAALGARRSGDRPADLGVPLD